MTTARKVGIWMDHSSATLMELTSGPHEARIIDSGFTHQEKEESLGRSEKLMHNKEQHQQADYYKKVSEAIHQYDDVLLFGPTGAKVELFNLLKADHRFEKITIHLETTDTMTDNQQYAFVKAYFQGSPIR
jgi:hypothetical protein